MHGRMPLTQAEAIKNRLRGAVPLSRREATAIAAHPEARALLLEALKAPETADQAALLLAEIGHPEDLAPLLALLGSCQEPQRLVIVLEALARLGRPAFEALAALARQPDGTPGLTRLAAAEGLSAMACLHEETGHDVAALFLELIQAPDTSPPELAQLALWLDMLDRREAFPVLERRLAECPDCPYSEARLNEWKCRPAGPLPGRLEMLQPFERFLPEHRAEYFRLLAAMLDQASVLPDSLREWPTRFERDLLATRQRLAPTQLPSRPAVGRNEPCPCGSGRRYKACHGAIGGAGAPVPTAAKDPDTLTREGIEAHRSGRIDEAKRCYESALAAAPDHPYAGHYLAVIAMQRRDYATAIPRLERAALARPDEPDFHSNLGLAYAAVDRIDDAIAAHRRSLALHPENASAWNNLGLALVEQCRHAEAVDAYRRALGIDPAFPKGRWNLAMARLMLGDRGGWADYEARLRIDELGHPPDIPGIARWHGGDVGGRTLILDAEQGYGDMLQFIRYAKVLAGRGARVIVRARDPVADLVRTAPGVSEVVPIEAIPRADAWLPLMSLPGILGIDPHGEPPDPPYLFADPSRTEAIRARLAQRRARLHVGLSWAGNPVQQNNRRRSIPLAVLAPLLERDDVAWYSLQRIDGEDEIASVPAARALVLPDERNEFMGKAALMGALDLVVSVCTSNAHLAGALARPTWIALAFAPDWRWGTAGASTRWYPTARLFRQPAPGDWTSVVRDIGLALDRRLAEP